MSSGKYNPWKCNLGGSPKFFGTAEEKTPSGSKNLS